MAKKRSNGRGHKFTAKERAAGRKKSDVDEILDEQFLVARDAVHQYVSMVADSMAAEAGEDKIPAGFSERRAKIVGKIVRLVAREVKAYLKSAQSK